MYGGKTGSTPSQMGLILVPLTESKYENEEVKAHLIMKLMEEALFELSQAAEKCDKAERSCG